MSEPDTSDRRRFTRLPFDTQGKVTLLTKGGTVSDIALLDLCLQGALVELPGASLAPLNGERVTLELNLDGVEAIISMDTTVVYIAEQRVGLRCLAMDLDSITHLRRLVELNLGDAALFQREMSLLGHPIPLPPLEQPE